MLSAHDLMRNDAIFRLLGPATTQGTFTPRLGRVTLNRSSSNILEMDTPGIITSTSRGIVPHLSRDHVDITQAIKWVHVPFETFLERVPPITSLQQGPHPLNTLLGFARERHIVSMSLRDPFDGRELPPNGKDYVNANTVRGVRKMDPATWRTHAHGCRPDFVVALSDTPFSPAPFSQKRIAKSIERSMAWLASLLQPVRDESDAQTQMHPLNVLVHMSGDTSEHARRAFAAGLTEVLYGTEAEQVNPLRTLDEGVCGYTFDLVPLRASLGADAEDTLPTHPHPPPPTLVPRISALMRASLDALPPGKLRVVNSAGSPHEMLSFVRDVGVDLFDAQWAQRAADWGVALDFVFPAPREEQRRGPRVRDGGKRDLGHNLYDAVYAHDFSRLAAAFGEGACDGGGLGTGACPCLACSPIAPAEGIRYSAVDDVPLVPLAKFDPPFVRAYVHHLLHTHEMSAHTFLAAHNLAVLDVFFAEMRRVLVDPEEFEREAERFCSVYDGELRLFAEAKEAWVKVELARGKGRLAREKAKQAEAALGTTVGLEAT